MRSINITKKTILVGVAVFMISIAGTFLYISKLQAAVQTNSQGLPIYSLQDISAFDGTDPVKPIYLVYEGNVYDVTAGKEYYIPGGSYHYLAGKDSTNELRLFGGEIIKKKYPIVGVIQ